MKLVQTLTTVRGIKTTLLLLNSHHYNLA